MGMSGVLQLSLVSKRELQSLYQRVNDARRQSWKPIRSLSMSILDATDDLSVAAPIAKFRRCVSMSTTTEEAAKFQQLGGLDDAISRAPKCKED